MIDCECRRTPNADITERITHDRVSHPSAALYCHGVAAYENHYGEERVVVLSAESASGRIVFLGCRSDEVLLTLRPGP